jgi:hypothetical protein
MRARLSRVFLSVVDDRVLAKAHGLALPLTSSPAQLLHPFEATNTGSQIGAEKTAVGCLTGGPAHGAKTKIVGAEGVDGIRDESGNARPRSD